MARLLFVDDQASRFDSLVMMFQDLGGHEVVVAGDYSAAVERVQESAFDVIILDILFPPSPGSRFEIEGKYPGVRLAHQLRNELNLETPILFVSVCSEECVTELTKTYKAIEFFGKPVSASKLLAAIDRLVLSDPDATDET